MKHILFAKSAFTSLLALGLFAPFAHAKYTVSVNERPVYQVQFILSTDDYFKSAKDTTLNDIGNSDISAIAKILNESVLQNIANTQTKFNLSEPVQLYVVVNTITPKLSALDKSRASAIYQSLLPKLHPDLANLFLTIDNGLGKRVNKSEVPVTNWDSSIKASRPDGNMYDAQFIGTNPKECVNGKCYTRSTLNNKVLITIAYTGTAGFVTTPAALDTDKETHYDIGVITNAVWCNKRLHSRKQCEQTYD